MIRKSRPRKTQGRLVSFLRSKRNKLKAELDHIYYALPFDEIEPVLRELKETVDALIEVDADRNALIVNQRKAA